MDDRELVYYVIRAYNEGLNTDDPFESNYEPGSIERIAYGVGYMTANSEQEYYH